MPIVIAPLWEKPSMCLKTKERSLYREEVQEPKYACVSALAKSACALNMGVAVASYYNPTMQLRITRLFMLLILVAAGFVAYPLYKLSFGSLPIEPQSAYRWRLFGEEFLEEGYQQDTRKLGVEPEDQVSLLTNIFRPENEAVNDLVRHLGSLQLSCYNRQENGALGEKYAKFLEVLAIYTKFHREQRNSKSTKRLVWVCDAYQACGGLADRVKGATYALILAMLSQRALYLNWRDSSFGEQTFLQPSVIDWTLTDKQKVYMYAYSDEMEMEESPQDNSKVKQVHIFSILGGIGVDLPMEDLKMSLDAIGGETQWLLLETNMEPSSLLNNTKTASLEWIKQGMDALGLAKLSPEDVDSLVGLVFRYLFKFTEQLLVELGTARKALGLDNQPYVGVHVRTGFAGSIKQESVDHPKLFRSMWQWDKTLSCAHKYTTKELGSSSFLFLATDSYLVKMKTLDDRYRHQFRSLDNTVVHLDKIDKFPHDAEDFETEGVLNTWIDLILLAESYSIIHGRSGFSFLAQSLCFIPRTRVIDGLQCTPLEAA